MKVYINTIQFFTNGLLDYSFTNKISYDKEEVKRAALNSLRQQMNFWENSVAYNEVKMENYCRVVLDMKDGIVKKYIIEAKELS